MTWGLRISNKLHSDAEPPNPLSSSDVANIVLKVGPDSSSLEIYRVLLSQLLLLSSGYMLKVPETEGV